MLDVDFEVIQQSATVLSDAEQVNPGAVRAPGPTGGLTVYRYGP